jgi:hypothetical protein
MNPFKALWRMSYAMADKIVSHYEITRPTKYLLEEARDIAIEDIIVSQNAAGETIVTLQGAALSALKDISDMRGGVSAAEGFRHAIGDYGFFAKHNPRATFAEVKNGPLGIGYVRQPFVVQ